MIGLDLFESYLESRTNLHWFELFLWSKECNIKPRNAFFKLKFNHALLRRLMNCANLLLLLFYWQLLFMLLFFTMLCVLKLIVK